MYLWSDNLIELFTEFTTNNTFVHLCECSDVSDMHDDSSSQYIPYKLEDELLNAINIRDTQKILHVIKEFNKYSPAILCKNDNIRSIKNNIIANCAVFTRMFVKIGLDEKKAFRLNNSFINKVEELKTIDELIRFNSFMLITFMYHTHNETDFGLYSMITRRAIRYIDSNLYTPFTIDDMAQALHTTPSYLSRVFKKDTDLTINKFIHAKRIETAKQLLIFTEKPLGEISESLGYSDQSHFNRVFKSDSNMTPLQYRKDLSHIKESDYYKLLTV